MKNFNEFSNEGLKHMFRKNDFILKGFIGRKMRLKIGDKIEEKKIVEDPTYSRSISDLGFYGGFSIKINFTQRVASDLDPFGEENYTKDDINNIIIFNNQKIIDTDHYNPGSFDWDSVPQSLEIEEANTRKELQIDMGGVELIKDLIKAIADKEEYVDGKYKHKGFHNLKYFFIDQLKRGDSIF